MQQAFDIIDEMNIGTGEPIYINPEAVKHN